jgi:ABC-type dipeptide/oligopeptide/nickel transport system permease component
MREDYVRTARAKGVGPKLVMWRHVLKNAMLPVLTIAGLSLAFSLGGSVAVEYAFSINGLGMVMITALMDKDFATVQNLVLIYSLVFVLINLLTDLSYALLDPRIRYD